jgi:hypothetical protein
MAVIREATQFSMCCNKCAGCITSTDCCADNFVLVAGDVPSPDTKQIGQHLIDEVPNVRVIGSASGKWGSTTATAMSRGVLLRPYVHPDIERLINHRWTRAMGQDRRPNLFRRLFEVVLRF